MQLYLYLRGGVRDFLLRGGDSRRDVDLELCCASSFRPELGATGAAGAACDGESFPGGEVVDTLTLAAAGRPVDGGNGMDLSSSGIGSDFRSFPLPRDSAELDRDFLLDTLPPAGLVDSAELDLFPAAFFLPACEEQLPSRDELPDFSPEYLESLELDRL